LGVPVARPDVIETTALGAAALAGLALGVWTGPEQFLAGRRYKSFVPREGARAVRARAAEWRRAVDAALHWAAAAGRARRGATARTSPSSAAGPAPREKPRGRPTEVAPSPTEGPARAAA